MNEPPTNRTPSSTAVWAEQLRVTGLAIRREAHLFFALLALSCLATVVFLRTPTMWKLLDIESLDAAALDPGMPGFGAVGVGVAALFPYLVWRGERSFGLTPLWTLPMHHTRHALMKVTAGWLWLTALLAGAIGLVLLALAVGGVHLGADEARTVVTDWAALRAGEADATRTVAWSTPWWQWAQPFTSATAAYLLCTTLVLGTRHPGRWLVVMYFATIIPGVIMEVTDIGWVERATEASAWFIGGYDYAGAARLATGEYVRGWSRMPSVGLWVTTASVWIGLGLAAVLATAARHRDHSAI